MAERYTIEDVPAWMIDRGVGHIIAGPGIGSGWAQWACGAQTPCGKDDVVREIPRRVCRQCRAELKLQRAKWLNEQ